RRRRDGAVAAGRPAGVLRRAALPDAALDRPATSWNILSGTTGYFSFGHGAFFGAGLYTTSTLLARFEWPFLWTLPVAAAVAALLGVALGAVVFRVRSVRGELFALLT